MPNSNLTYLGILAAPTKAGKQAVGVAITGAVDLYHLVRGDLDYSSEIVRDWLWTANVNPDEARASLPAAALIRDIVIPALAGRTLVVHHADLETPFVKELVSALREVGNDPIISGVDISGPLPQGVNGAAGRRAAALQQQYEAALEEAQNAPAIHRIAGSLNDAGDLTQISIAGPFAQRSWTVAAENEALFVMATILHIGDLAAFEIEPGPSEAQIKALADQVGLTTKLAA